MTARHVTQLGNERGAPFYLASLQYAQCLWRRGLPAQAILQLNRAFAAEIAPNEPLLATWPLPYAAMAYVIRHAAPEHFLGNPRRHFQHYATRMSGPRAALRTWRAWACWLLAREIHPTLPADEDQLAKEGICEPDEAEICTQLIAHGHPREERVWLSCF